MSKRLFDTIRTMLGRGLTQREVDEINASLDTRSTPDAPTQPETSGTPGHIGPEGIELIKAFEGCHKIRTDGMIEAYPDPGTGGAPWTIGWGATGVGIAPGVVWTRAQCDERLATDLVKYATDVAKALGPALPRTSQRQFDAMVSFHYNTGAIARATLTAKHRAGDFMGAAAEFDRWNRAGGRVMKGLVRRRTAERKLYEAGS